MIEFFDLDKENGVASFYDNHITFNKPMIKYFENAYRVRVGNDIEAKKVYLFIFDKDKALNGEVSESSLLKPSFSKTYVRICSKQLTDFILKAYEKKIVDDVPLKFKSSFDEEKKAVVIDMEGQIV